MKYAGWDMASLGNEALRGQHKKEYLTLQEEAEKLAKIDQLTPHETTWYGAKT